MNINLPQNPGIGGIDELTTEEELVVQNIASLGDPGADRILFWDESSNQFQYLTVGTGLTITGTTIEAALGSGDVVGPASSTNNNVVFFDGVTGKLIKDSGLTLSGTNTGDETTSTLGVTINGASAATPNDTDLVATVDTSVVKKITWTNVKAFLKTYFDTLYTAANSITARISGSTYYSVQHIQDLFHSAGWTSGGVISDAGSGVITVTGGTGLIRATDSDVATIYFTDFPASSPSDVTLTDGVTNYVYVEYNAGSPRIVTTTSLRTDYNTNFRIGTVFRSGTTLHINQTDKMAVSDHAGKMIRFNQEVMPYAHVSGASISATGTRNIALTAGAFWNGLIKFTTNSFDSSAAGTFTYYYYNGTAWVSVASQTQIDNTQYNNIASGLATLTANRYGVHWVYLGADSDVHVVYGQGDYTLTQAQDAMAPSSLPAVISSHAFIAGKIIIQKSASTFTQIESAFSMSFSPALATDHTNLVNLSWTTSGHTGTLSTLAGFNSSNVAAVYSLSGTGTTIPTTTSPTFVTPILGTPTSGTLTNCTGLPVAGITASTTTALGVGSIELGHASDTTIARSGAGEVTIEGVAVSTASNTLTLSNKTLTTPKVLDTGYIADDNGNEQIKFSTTASAVNEFTVKNAATGNAPQLQVTGGDTNIDLKLVPKGTGKVAPQAGVNHGAFTAYFTETDNGNSGTADTIDWGLSNKQKSTLTGNCTFTFTAPAGPCSLVLKLVQDATGSRTVTWPAAVHWSGGTAPTLTTTASKVDIITFYYDGSTYFGAATLNYTA